jgi:hypothetical protein
MIKFLNNLKTRTWFVLVTVVAIVVRVGLYIFYRPVSYSDTASYRRLADAILNGWQYYDGTRLPGYPILMALAGSNEHVYLVQLTLGLVTTLLLFYIGWRVSGKAWFAALVSLAHALNLQQLFFEADLISECLTTFFIVLTLVGIALLFSKNDENRPWKIILLAFWIGITGGAAALVRPLFIFLPLFSALIILLFWHKPLKVRWLAALVTGLVSLVIIGTWINFLHQHFGRWGLDTLTGYHLVQHTGAFFEYVPDQYAVIRDTFIRYRDERIAQTGSPANSIWDAIPALQQVSGLGFYNLSDLLAKISIELIVKHPGLYFISALNGWLWFWKVPVYWSPANLPTVFLSKLMGMVIFAERGGLFVFNLVFLGGTIALFWKKFRMLFKMDLFLWFLTGSLWLTSILQTLPDHGDNPRFSVPTQSILVFIVLYWVVNTVINLAALRGKK